MPAIRCFPFNSIRGSEYSDVIDGHANTTGMYVDGGEGDDIITGGSSSDFLVGRGGDNTISGGGGNDLLSGESSGIDILSGGAGNDSAVFRTE